MEPIANGNDYMSKYRLISSKLKKRFLRKPNVAEASEEFGHLARCLGEGEAWGQAGLCCVAVARCEQTLSNSSTEVSALTQAARYFLKAEFTNQQLHCPRFNEHLMTAITCYQHAIQLYLDNKKIALASSLAIELGQSLKNLGHPSEALCHLHTAETLLTNSPMDLLICLGFIASAYIELGDLDGALQIFYQMAQIVNENQEDPLDGAYLTILTRCEISSLLILLTLEPLPQQMKKYHSDLLDKYSWSSTESQSPDVPYDDCELCVLLQSLVLGCQGRDKEALSSLGVQLSARFSSEHLHLLDILLTEMNRS